MKVRNWVSLYNKKQIELNTSRDTIKYFERSNDLTITKNIESVKKIEELERERDLRVKEFENKYKLTFEDAKLLVDNSYHANRDFNLDEFNEISQLNDLIDGEKFYIYQRNRLVDRNKQIISSINDYIKRATESNK